MKNVILVTLLASTLGFGAAAVHANDTTVTPEAQSQHEAGKHKGKRGGRHGMMKRMIEELNLTEAQQAQVKALHEARKANKGEKGKRDKASREAGRAQFEAILTPAQLEKLKSLKANHKGKRGGKRQDRSTAE